MTNIEAFIALITLLFLVLSIFNIFRGIKL